MGILSVQRNVYKPMYVLRDNGNLIITHFIHVWKSKSKPLMDELQNRHTNLLLTDTISV